MHIIEQRIYVFTKNPTLFRKVNAFILTLF